VKRRRRLGSVADVEAGKQTLDEYVQSVFAPTHVALLARKTQSLYADLYDRHLAPEFGSTQLRQIKPSQIKHWQAARIKAGLGKPTLLKALTLLGSILQRACEDELIEHNPTRSVRRARSPKTAEVRPLAPAAVEAIRAAMLNPELVTVGASKPGQRARQAHAQPAPGTPYTRMRDATLVSVLAYAGLRPGEAMGLRWGDIRENTILVERSLSSGELKSTKTGGARTVRLLEPLAQDLREFKLASGRPSDKTLIFSGPDGGPWTTLHLWRVRNWKRALKAAGLDHARIYDLRHSFASLLAHEGRAVTYIGRQLGHSPAVSLRTYQHVIDELEATPKLSAEQAIKDARSTGAAHKLPIAVNRGANGAPGHQLELPELQAVPLSSTPSRARTGDLLRERQAS
jgi:integrase